MTVSLIWFFSAAFCFFSWFEYQNPLALCLGVFATFVSGYLYGSETGCL